MLTVSQQPAAQAQQPATPAPLPSAGIAVPMRLPVAAPPPAAVIGEPAPVVVPVLPAGNSSMFKLPELPADGYWIENAPLNEIFQYLARSANQQFFFNNLLSAPEFNVTGHLKLTDPKQQMDDLAVAYGLTVYQNGNTIHLMNEEQLARLPVEVMVYQLKYLRGARPSAGGLAAAATGGGEGGAAGGGLADFEKLKAIIKPMLTTGSGQIEFEEKTNVLLVTDNTVKLEKVRLLLEDLDRPKQQIVINVRILRVRKARGSNVGVNWNGVLGTGLPITATQSLNTLFNLPDTSVLTKSLTNTSGVVTKLDTFNRTYTDGAGLVFTSPQVTAIVHALQSRDLVTQEACPTIITEDNEEGIISIVDRFPIITANVSVAAAAQVTTDIVRYKIDETDPDPMLAPDKSREIGVTLSVTPTLLPDGTVRMKIRPRVAKIVELITGRSGNVFPRVSESTIEGISRIPNGQSLFLGGFYDSDESYSSRKVPVLSSIPFIGSLFSYKNKTADQISLVFIITPRIYDAGSDIALPAVNNQVRWGSGFNRSNPDAPVTPLLPDPSREDDHLPVPVDRNSLEPMAPTPKKSSWLGRLFTKPKPAAEKNPSPRPEPQWLAPLPAR